MCGVGAELGQAMNEIAFDELDAPVGRLHTEPVIASARAVARAHDAGRRRQDRRRRARTSWPAARRCPGTGAIPALRRPRRPRPLLRRARGQHRRARRAFAADTPKPAAKAATGGEPITMPFGDLTVSEGKIVRWAKTEGDVRQGRASSSPRSRPTRRWSRSRRRSPAGWRSNCRRARSCRWAAVSARCIEGRRSMSATAASPQRIRATPYARRLARERGLPLSAIAGSGPNGRITGDDLLNRYSPPVAEPVAVAKPEIAARPPYSGGRRH